jgi:probable F420-dependent oxidoreductase
MIHPFATEASVRTLTIPALERGLARAGRTLADLEIALPQMIVTGDTDEELAGALGAVKAQLAFYGSTPAYKVVLDVHGWGDAQPELNRLSKAGRWPDMAALITDEMVDAFVIRGAPETIAKQVRARYGTMVQRISFNSPYQAADDRWVRVLQGFREL